MKKIGVGVELAPFRYWKGALFFLINAIFVSKNYSNEFLKLKSAQIWNMQFRISPLNPDLNRHQVGDSLRRCSAEAQKAKVLVFAFEGTASFDPRRAFALKHALKSLVGKIDTHTLKNEVFVEIENAAWAGPKYRELPRWSGLLLGPILNNAEDFAREDVEWWNFPSEEFEAIAYPEKLMMVSPSTWYEETQIAKKNHSPGLASALKCVKEIGVDIHQKKIVLLAHSSGVRTAIKFADALKDQYPNLRIPLAFGIDPVEEVQWVVDEIVLQHLNYFREGEVAIKSRTDRSGLYKPSNVNHWMTVYQNVDTYGFGFQKMKFGIHGSPVRGAVNHYISLPENRDLKAHGTICYHPDTLKLWSREFKWLLKGLQ